LNFTHPLHDLAATPHYLVVENLRGLTRQRPFVWDSKTTTGKIVGMARFYPVAEKILPGLRWPAAPEERAVLEKHFPMRSIQLSCGGVVDQRRPLSFADHPDLLFRDGGEEPRDTTLFGRTHTILWLAGGDEEQIAKAMLADGQWLAEHFNRERENMPPEMWMYSRGASTFIHRWFADWYLSRLCRLPGQPDVDVDLVYRILDAD